MQALGQAGAEAQGSMQQLADAGLRYLQLDDTNLAYLCDTQQRERARARGEDPNALPLQYAHFINRSLAAKPADMVTAIHLCRGNYRSSWAAEGGYEPVAEVLFNELKVDAFFLEYDDARSGDFSPLRHVPPGKTVVLGLVTTKLGELETADSIKRRIDEAARYCPLEQLALSPQCGFASTEQGNDVSVAQQAQVVGGHAHHGEVTAQLVQRQRAAPGRLVAPQRRHELVQLSVVALAQADDARRRQLHIR